MFVVLLWLAIVCILLGNESYKWEYPEGVYCSLTSQLTRLRILKSTINHFLEFTFEFSSLQIKNSTQCVTQIVTLLFDKFISLSKQKSTRSDKFIENVTNRQRFLRENVLVQYTYRVQWRVSTLFETHSTIGLVREIRRRSLQKRRSRTPFPQAISHIQRYCGDRLKTGTWKICTWKLLSHGVGRCSSCPNW